MKMFGKFRHISTLLKESPVLSYSKQCYIRRIHLNAMLKANESPDSKIPLHRTGRFEIFKDEPVSPIIIDVEEERKAIEKKFKPLEEEKEEEKYDQFYGISPERGLTGVIEVEEAVNILKLEKAIDIVTIKVPEEYNFCDYFIIVTAKSKRHMTSMAEFMRKVFKYKKNKNDEVPRIEGKDSSDWVALDLGNINLHIFSPKARNKFDLECLWSVGWKHDPKCNEPPSALELVMSQHITLLSSLKPAENK